MLLKTCYQHFAFVVSGVFVDWLERLWTGNWAHSDGLCVCMCCTCVGGG